MHALQSRLSRHLATFAAVAFPAALVSPTVSGAIVLNSGLSITIPSTVDGLYLNVVTGATGTTAATRPAGWDVNLFSASTLSLFSPTPSPGGGAYVGTGSQYDFMFHSFGVSVGPANSFTSTGTVNPNLSSPFTLPSSGQYGIGFRFLNESTNAVHYGFMYLELGSTLGGQPRRLLGYYYESSPGVPLSLPTPGTALTLLLPGLLIGRRKR